MKLNEAISKRLKNIFLSKNLTAYKVADVGGIDRQVIYDVLNCEYQKVSVYTIYQITETLGISLTEFFNDPLFDDISD